MNRLLNHSYFPTKKDWELGYEKGKFEIVSNYVTQQDGGIGNWGIFINGVLVATINGQVDINAFTKAMFKTAEQCKGSL